MSLLQVRKAMCETCIFRPGNVMALRPGRVKGMVDECRETQSFIPCHETMVPVDPDNEDDERMTGPVCKGFYDAHGEVSQLVRIAGRLGAIEEVD